MGGPEYRPFYGSRRTDRGLLAKSAQVLTISRFRDAFSPSGVMTFHSPGLRYLAARTAIVAVTTGTAGHAAAAEADAASVTHIRTSGRYRRADS